MLKDIPGELHERPWKDFGHNRTEAIELARGKGDYLFVIDADDVLAIPPRFAMPKLTKDSYQLRVEDAGTSYLRIHLFRSDLDYHYLGVLHEVLMSAEKRSMGRIDGLVYQRTGGGARSVSPNKYRRDAEVLEAALAAEPKNARYAFYLAQSWRDAGELEKAIAAYEQRAQMGGWEEEVYFSLHEVAKLSAKLGKDDGARHRRLPPRLRAPPHPRRAALQPRRLPARPRPEDGGVSVRARRERDPSPGRHSVRRRLRLRLALARRVRRRRVLGRSLQGGARRQPAPARRAARCRRRSASGCRRTWRSAARSSEPPRRRDDRARLSPVDLRALGLRARRGVVALVSAHLARLPGTGFEERVTPGMGCDGAPTTSIVREPFVARLEEAPPRCVAWKASLVARSKMRAHFEVMTEGETSLALDGHGVLRDQRSKGLETRPAYVDIKPGVHQLVATFRSTGGPAYLRLAMDDELEPHDYTVVAPLDDDSSSRPPPPPTPRSTLAPRALRGVGALRRPRARRGGDVRVAGDPDSGAVAKFPRVDLAIGAALFGAALYVRSHALGIQDMCWDEGLVKHRRALRAKRGARRLLH